MLIKLALLAYIEIALLADIDPDLQPVGILFFSVSVLFPSIFVSAFRQSII